MQKIAAGDEYSDVDRAAPAAHSSAHQASRADAGPSPLDAGAPWRVGTHRGRPVVCSRQPAPPAGGLGRRDPRAADAFAGRLRGQLRDYGHGRRPTAERSAIVQQGDYWTIVHEGRQLQLRDSKGVRYLAQLLHHPGREFHSLDLVTESAGGRGGPRSGGADLEVPVGDAGFVLDEAAKSAYRARLTALDEELEEATDRNDLGRIERVAVERDFLVAELAAAVGLGGRDRRAASDAERARQSVTKAVRRVIERISSVDVRLGSHLRATVRTGIFHTYAPDPRVPAVWA